MQVSNLSVEFKVLRDLLNILSYLLLFYTCNRIFGEFCSCVNDLFIGLYHIAYWSYCLVLPWFQIFGPRLWLIWRFGLCVQTGRWREARGAVDGGHGVVSQSWHLFFRSLRHCLRSCLPISPWSSAAHWGLLADSGGFLGFSSLWSTVSHTERHTGVLLLPAIGMFKNHHLHQVVGSHQLVISISCGLTRLP